MNDLKKVEKMIFYGKCSNCNNTYEKPRSELEIVDIKQAGTIVDCYYRMWCEECGTLIKLSHSKNDEGDEMDQNSILKIINGKKYLDVKQMQKDDIYLFLIKRLRHLCHCGGWGCIFCCEDYDDVRLKAGGGY